MKVTQEMIDRFGLVDSGEFVGNSIIYDLRIYISTLKIFEGFWFMECGPNGQPLGEEQLFILYTGKGKKKGFKIGRAMLEEVTVEMVGKTFEGMIN